MLANCQLLDGLYVTTHHNAIELSKGTAPKAKIIADKRLIESEKQKYGENIEPGGNKYNQFLEFIEWASKYDDGGINIRSKTLHEEWLSSLKCSIVRLEGDLEKLWIVKNTANNCEL